MTHFIILAGLMALIAAALVAVPLLRSGGDRRVGIVAALCILGAAAGLYPAWSSFDWRAAAADRPAKAADVAAMLAKLEAHLAAVPDDQTGWLLLGRSYLTLERMDDALSAYRRAYALDHNADAALGLGEAQSLKAGGEITPEAGQLFEEALKLQPNNPKALLYGGFAAAARGDAALARLRWESLKALHPPQQIVAMLDTRIAELGPAGGGTASSAAGTNAAAPDSTDVAATVNIALAPQLKASMKADAPLFVFAQMPGQPGPPLAAKRLTTAAIGTQVRLTPADSMLPGRVLTKGAHVSITARVSFSGQPMPASGDLYGEVSYEIGRDGVANLLIDRVVQ